MAVDLEKILRPVESSAEAVRPAKYMLLGERRHHGDPCGRSTRDEVPGAAQDTSPRSCSTSSGTYYDLVAARVYAELLGWYHHRMQDRVRAGGADRWRAGGHRQRPPPSIAERSVMSLHTLALRRGLRIGAHAFAAKMEYHIDHLWVKTRCSSSPSRQSGFRRWMIEYQLEERFDTCLTSWAVCRRTALTRELFDRARSSARGGSPPRATGAARQGARVRDPAPVGSRRRLPLDLPGGNPSEVRLHRQRP